MGQVTPYDDRTKINAAYLYAASGNYSKVARETGISRPTLMGWAKENVLFIDSVDKARQEISSEILAGNLEIVVKTNEQVMDRIENGDVVLRNGEEVRVPMKGRDLAIISGIKEDKARVALGQATSISGSDKKTIEELADQFRKLSADHRAIQDSVVATVSHNEAKTGPE